MGPDFNNDGRVDGYDMEYLDGSESGAGNAGCGGCFKVGCLVLALILVLSGLFSACSMIFYSS